MRNDTYIFIPSYHRPFNIKTAKFFKSIGWDMSRVFVFIDSETNDKEQYKKSCTELGCNLQIFDMDDARLNYDYVHRGSPSLRSAGQARNTFQDFAMKNGIDFYCVQDDDTRELVVKTIKYSRAKKSAVRVVFDGIEDMMRRRHIGVFAILQSGDMIEGYRAFYAKYLYKRKAMNCTFYLLPYIYKGERGVQDDDTSMFCGILNAGLFTGSVVAGLTLQQEQSATQNGGLTDLYNECKLLNKALVCPIQYPSAVYAQKQVRNGNRIHHRIVYNHLAPCLIKTNDPKRDNIAWDKWAEDAPFTQAAIYIDWRKKEIRKPAVQP